MIELQFRVITPEVNIRTSVSDEVLVTIRKVSDINNVLTRIPPGVQIVRVKLVVHLPT